MRKFTVTTIAASALATFAIGLAAPALAAPTGVDNNQTTVSDYNDYPMSGQTQYGTYQNDHKDRSPVH